MGPKIGSFWSRPVSLKHAFMSFFQSSPLLNLVVTLLHKAQEKSREALDNIDDSRFPHLLTDYKCIHYLFM